MNERFRRFGLALIVIAVLTGCASHWEPEHAENPYGFIFGLWHGFIFFFALFGVFLSWVLQFFGITFLDGVQLIGQPNTGLWYYVGFAIGIVAALSPAGA